MIDVKQRVVTRLGDEAKFIQREMHPRFPLIFSVGGVLRSYTEDGRTDVRWPTPFDVMNFKDYSPATFQMTLFD